MGFKSYRDCGYTCNPQKFEIPALRFPCRVPVIPCKHLQCRHISSFLVDTLTIFQLGRSDYAEKFVVPFFSGSWLLALKFSSKTHQMTFLFIQNHEVFTKTMSLFSQFSFGIREVVIDWLFNNEMRARGQEVKSHKNKEPKILRLCPPHRLVSNTFFKNESVLGKIRQLFKINHN